MGRKKKKKKKKTEMYTEKHTRSTYVVLHVCHRALLPPPPLRKRYRLSPLRRSNSQQKFKLKHPQHSKQLLCPIFRLDHSTLFRSTREKERDPLELLHPIKLLMVYWDRARRKEEEEERRKGDITPNAARLEMEEENRGRERERDSRCPLLLLFPSYPSLQPPAERLMPLTFPHTQSLDPSLPLLFRPFSHSLDGGRGGRGRWMDGLAMLSLPPSSGVSSESKRGDSVERRGKDWDCSV